MMTLNADEFARRLREMVRLPDRRFAFFLGAGCSVSSGIPSAGILVKDYWLPVLRDVTAPHRKDLDDWAQERFPSYDPMNPAASYGVVMNALFLQPVERQQEIERLCDEHFPGFGYAVLASLMALNEGRFNVTLTTNFDDLISDALYLFTNARPLVVHHESLADFIRPTRTRPLVVKLHGDNRLAPQNTPGETARIREGMERRLHPVLHDRGVIFIGYGGRDEGIYRLLASLSDAALPLGVYWVAGHEPTGIIRPWLEERNALWVQEGDFDQLMLLVRDVFDLPHPDSTRFDKVFALYRETYDVLSRRIQARADDDVAVVALKQAVERADKSMPNQWVAIRAAEDMGRSDPQGAQELYERAIQEHPSSSPVLLSYAGFLTNRLRDYKKAEEIFGVLQKLDPKNGRILSAYAHFLANAQKDNGRAEQFYRRAVDANPTDGLILASYANFLSKRAKNYVAAEEQFNLAASAGARFPSILTSYATFLIDKKRDFVGAERVLEQALAAAPDDPEVLSAYASCLVITRKRPDMIEEYLQRALRVDPVHSQALVTYAHFFKDLREDYPQAEHYLAQAIRSTQYDDPEQAIVPLANYTDILLAQGKMTEGLAALGRSLDCVGSAASAAGLECWFYALVYWPVQRGGEALGNLKRILLTGVRSPDWSLRPHIRHARDSRRADANWLEKLASVIADEATIDGLEEWRDWRTVDG